MLTDVAMGFETDNTFYICIKFSFRRVFDYNKQIAKFTYITLYIVPYRQDLSQLKGSIGRGHQSKGKW